MPRISHAPTTAGRSGSAASSSTTATSACSRELVERGREAAARRVAHPAHARRRARAAPPRARAPARCRSRARPRAASSPRATITAMPWSPSVPETSTRSPGRTRSGPSSTPVGDDADAGRRHVERRPPCRARRPSCRRSRPARRRPRAARAIERGDAAQVGDREALLDDEPGRERERPRAGDREVVDRAVDGELADVAAGEEERLDDVGVGREREPRRRSARAARSRRAGRAAGCRAPRGRAPSTRARVALPPAPWASVIELVAELRPPAASRGHALAPPASRP